MTSSRQARSLDDVLAALPDDQLARVEARGAEILSEHDRETTRFDPADCLENEEDIAVFLEDAHAEGDASDIVHAEETVARARARIAKESTP